MNRPLFSSLVTVFVVLFWYSSAFSAEENFLVINGVTDEVVLEMGPHVNERITTCSTFKIVLSLMGYDVDILKDENNPTWDFQEGYLDFMDSWKAPQTPQSWMKNSCLWYSQVLATQIGLDTIQDYLAFFDYGNQDFSGGLVDAWRNSSLKISPAEQVEFVQKMICEKLPVSNHAVQMTKALLFVEELPEGWRLFGKTGLGSICESDGISLEVGWFVGWVEKDQTFFPLAYNIRDIQISRNQRIPRVKQLLAEQLVSSGRTL